MTLTTAAGKVCEGIDQGPFEPIAIVGASALMPDAESMEQFGRISSMQRSALEKLTRQDGEMLLLGGSKEVQETQLKDSLMQRLVHLLKVLNLIGSDGANHQELYHR